MISKKCFYCEKPFEAQRETARYCSDTCKTYASQERTGKRIKKESDDSIHNNDDLFNQYKSLEKECIDLYSLRDNYQDSDDKFKIEKKIFVVQKSLFNVCTNLFNNGFSGQLKYNEKHIPVFPFDYDDLNPIHILGRPTHPFIAYIYHGSSMGNTNLMLRMASNLIDKFDFKIVYFTESLKKFNAGQVDDDDFVSTKTDLEKMTLKIVKNRDDVESFLKKQDVNFDFAFFDTDKMNLDYDFLEGLQQTYFNLAIICATLKPIQCIIKKADHILKLCGGIEDLAFGFTNTTMDYSLDTWNYFGSIPFK